MPFSQSLEYASYLLCGLLRTHTYSLSFFMQDTIFGWEVGLFIVYFFCVMCCFCFLAYSNQVNLISPSSLKPSSCPLGFTGLSPAFQLLKNKTLYREFIGHQIWENLLIYCLAHFICFNQIFQLDSKFLKGRGCILSWMSITRNTSYSVWSRYSINPFGVN